jgi:hypothetical protein
MPNYYLYKIDSGIDTFSQFEAGVNFNFTSTTISPDIEFQEGDLIIGVKLPVSFYILQVNKYTSGEISLTKLIEVNSEYQIKFQDSRVIKPIESKEYQEIIDNILNDFIESSTNTRTHQIQAEPDLNNLKERFADWMRDKNKIRKNYFSNNFNSNMERFIKALDEYEDIYKDEFGSLIFSTPNQSLDDFIAEIENNLYTDSGIFFDFSQKKSTHMPRAILGKNNYLAFLNELFKNQIKSNSNSPKVKPVNKIYFGAPGTGKSHQITEDLKDVGSIFQKRITFHPEFDNASFVGGYKPITDRSGDIKYEFVPQIFTNIYLEACNDPLHQYYLIIEEINRGNCAEIFGELFQLLDRNENYKITPSNELAQYLKNNISNSRYYSDDKMLLPDNLSILATMNTSDQSLYPMDSAFKRRWEWEYIPINYNKNPTVNRSASFKIQVGKDSIDWILFIKTINKKIQENPNLGMDKCIGNYFIEPDLNNIITLDKFIYKVIFYLWNDVFKDEPKDSIFGNKTYEDFFPLESEGMQIVRKIFDDLDILKSENSDDQIKSVD